MRSLMGFTGVLIILLCIGTAQAAESPSDLAKQHWNQWRSNQKEFPIAAWSYFSRYLGSVQEYTMYHDAGLNMVQAPLVQAPNAFAAGVNVLFGSWENLHKDTGKLNLYMKAYAQEDKPITGYTLFDEPSPTEFAALGKAVETIYQEDQRGAIPIITLLPNWAVSWSRFKMTYQEYVHKFVEQVHPALLLHTHYPTMNDGTDRKEYYSNLELFRNEAAAAEIGMMGFVLVTQHGNYRQPSESDIKWQVYSLLAYGAKGLWYYNYRIGDSKYGDGLVTHATGMPSVTYPIVQEVNNEVQSIGRLLLTLDSTTVIHTGNALPMGTRGYEPGSLAAIDDFTGDDFLVGQFRSIDTPSDDVYLMVVNKRHGSAANLDGTFSYKLAPDFKQVWLYPLDGSASELQQPDAAGNYRMTLPGGQGVLMRLSR